MYILWVGRGEQCVIDGALKASERDGMARAWSSSGADLLSSRASCSIWNGGWEGAQCWPTLTGLGF